MSTTPTGQRTSRRPWQGGALMSAGWASFAGAVGDNRAHAHHALQLVVAETGEIEVFTQRHGLVRAPAVLLDADVVHQLPPGPARLLYLDRESHAGRVLSLSCVAGSRTFTSQERDSVLDAWPGTHRLEVATVVAALGLSLPSAAPSSAQQDRVRRVLDSLLTRSDWSGSLASLAAEASLSPSRFRHRARDVVGMPLRPYLRWLRLRRALELAARGSGLTQAAQDAGFADAAHLTRTMQRHFGVAPRDVVTALRQGH